MYSWHRLLAIRVRHVLFLWRVPLHERLVTSSRQTVHLLHLELVVNSQLWEVSNRHRARLHEATVLRGALKVPLAFDAARQRAPLSRRARQSRHRVASGLVIVINITGPAHECVVRCPSISNRLACHNRMETAPYKVFEPLVSHKTGWSTQPTVIKP